MDASLFYYVATCSNVFETCYKLRDRYILYTYTIIQSLSLYDRATNDEKCWMKGPVASENGDRICMSAASNKKSKSNKSFSRGARFIFRGIRLWISIRVAPCVTPQSVAIILLVFGRADISARSN